MLILLLQIVVILAVSRAAARLLAPFGQPAVVGEMIAGLILGPSLFGYLMPGASAALFALPSLPALGAVSQMGLVLFMFLVGIHLASQDLRGHKGPASVMSLTSIIVPFALGALLGSVLHARLAPAGVPVLPFSLFIGTAMSITAFPVLARMLIAHGILKTELGVMAITCAAFDDVTGWFVLAGVVTLVRAQGTGVFLTHALMFAGYVLVMVAVVRPALRAYGRRRGTRFGASADDLALALFVMLLSAALTEALGVHALFGAFFAGLMMPIDDKAEPVIVERMELLTTTLFVPLFFAVTGLRTSVQLINSPELWRDAGLIFLVAVIGKGASSTLVARAMGIEWRKSATLGVLLNTRGLIELVVLNIGLELGILSPAIFSMLFLMALATTMMTSPLVGWLLRTSPAAVGQPMVLYPITHLQLPRSPGVLNEHPAMLSVSDGARNNVVHGGESTPRRAGFTRNDRQN